VDRLRPLLLCLWLAPALALAAAPQRIVTLAPHLAELVCAAGGCDRLVGVSRYTDAPPHAASLPRIGDAYTVNVEAVVALRPDLVIAWDGGTPRASVDKLQHVGVPVEWLRVDSLEGVEGALRQLGRRLQTAPIAEAAAQRYRAGLAQLRQRYSTAAPLRVLYQLGTSPVYTVLRDSPITAAIAVCGGRNIFGDLPGLSAPVSDEAVLTRAPEVVLYDREVSAPAIRAYWQRMASAEGPQPRAIREINGNALPHGSPRVLDGIAEVCRILDAVRREAAVTRPGSAAR
jgi:ABC-type Fe3+-hydroxamate transport system substrate-binding protein